MAAPEWSVVKKLSSSSMNVTPNEADHKSVLKLVRKHEPAIMDISGIRELWQLIPVHYHCWILLRSIKKVQTAEELLSLMNEIELEDRHKEAITRIYYAAKFVAHFSEQVTRDRVLCTNWVFNQLSRTKDELFTMNDAGPFKTLSGSGDFTEGAFTSFDRLVGLVVTLWEEREGYSDVEQQYLAQCASCVDLDRIAAYIRADGTAGEIIRSLDDLKKYCRQLAGKSCFTLMAQYASLIRNSETLFWMMQNYLAPSYHDEMANLYYASCFTRYFNFRSTGSREGGTIRVIQWMADKLPRDHDFIFTRSSETYPYPVPFCILLNKSGKDSFQSVDNAHDLVGLVLRLWKHRADLPKALREAVMLCDKLANLDNIMAFLPAIKMKHELEIMMQRIPLGYEESILDVQVAKLYNRLVVALTNGSVIELPYLLSTYRSLSLMLNAPLLVANDGVSPSFAELARLERYGVNIASRFQEYGVRYQKLDHSPLRDESLQALLQVRQEDQPLLVSPRMKELLIWHALTVPISKWTEDFIKVIYFFCASNQGQLYSPKLESQLIWMVTSAAYLKDMIEDVEDEPAELFVPVCQSDSVCQPK